MHTNKFTSSLPIGFYSPAKILFTPPLLRVYMDHFEKPWVRVRVNTWYLMYAKLKCKESEAISSLPTHIHQGGHTELNIMFRSCSEVDKYPETTLFSCPWHKNKAKFSTVTVTNFHYHTWQEWIIATLILVKHKISWLVYDDKI